MSDKVEQIDLAVADALRRLGANTDCPRCGNQNFHVLKGFFAHSIQTDPRGVVMGGPMVRTAVLVCTRCGYMVQHDLDILGMTPAGEARH